MFFQVETIGDAYCVAGGLHRKSKYHAQQIAWMGLKMMETAKNELSHDGNVIRVSIFIFSLVIRKINIIALTHAVIYLKYFYFVFGENSVWKKLQQQETVSVSCLYPT